MANQFRNFCITLNNPVQSDSEFFDYLKFLPHIKYFVFQREKGDSGTEHFQLYIEFSLGKRFDVMKNYFPRAHIEQRHGTKKQAADYCKDKDTRISDTFYEFGDFAEERERTDLTDIMEMIKSGCSDSEIRENYPSQFFHNYRKIDNLRKSYVEERFMTSKRDLYVVYISGSPGVGKTMHVLNTHGFQNVFKVFNYGVGMFDSYRGQDVILFDEFHSSVRIELILNYLDVYPLMLPARYGDKVACYTKVYIVSNVSLFKQYSDIQSYDINTYKAFLRRIDVAFDFDISREIPVLKPFERFVQGKLNLISDPLPFG
ncbi:MAG: replication protein [Clostridiales bacterium]|jgi:hypothetical protein|nr:replication protein [Clostridiales bacterium]